MADRSTAELMVGFYQQLDRAGDKAEALRQAKLGLIWYGANVRRFDLAINANAVAFDLQALAGDLAIHVESVATRR